MKTATPLAKRSFDVLVAGSVLLLAFPALLLIALLIRGLMGAPVIFRQSRPGLHGGLFTIYKFRTMRDAPGAADAGRLTAFGKLLRATSLDELPSLWNVLRGDMSLVGPRPLLPEYLPLYTPEQQRRHDVLPGLTGWAQIHGRNAISWEEKFRLDVWYVDHQSFWLDLKIIGATFRKVLTASGVRQKDHVTAERFRGSTMETGKQKQLSP